MRPQKLELDHNAILGSSKGTVVCRIASMKLVSYAVSHLKPWKAVRSKVQVLQTSFIIISNKSLILISPHRPGADSEQLISLNFEIWCVNSTVSVCCLY